MRGASAGAGALARDKPHSVAAACHMNATIEHGVKLVASRGEGRHREGDKKSRQGTNARRERG